MEEFIADVHLGKLARYLRLMGFDTLNTNSFSEFRMWLQVNSANRILLSRNPANAIRPGMRTLLIQSESTEKQLQQVITSCDLADGLKPFSRCAACNALLEKTGKDIVIDQLQDKTATFYNEFWWCTGCARIYWKGSHYERMQKLIEIIGH